ncbi:MAG: FliM/FliN family flagellar motor switch protein [Thermoguttaceae bacterium]|nr:FliM/FliN family flagellar motor switch protein [Thermoguttaceae bacterium]
MRLLFDAALGFDVAALCANKALYGDFNADARQPLTPFEEEAFAPEFPRFAALSPLATAAPDASSSTDDAWRLVSSLLPPSRAAFALDAPLLYWERRSIRLAEQVFPWTVVFSTRFLASLIDAAPCRDAAQPTNSPPSPFSSSSSSSRLDDSPRPTFDAFSFPCDEPPFSPVESSPSRLDAAPKTAFDLSIVVEQGQMSAESWRRLKPGDLLTTNVPANALFLGLLDGAPRFLCRPGLFRGAAAVQIKGEAGDDRE